MVDDPSSHPDRFPTEESQDAERQRLFELIEQIVLWDNTNNEKLLDRVRAEIWKSWRITCADNCSDSQAAELYKEATLPAFHDPFAGGGALPLEAQRLGLESFASDLNPVAVLINKGMIEIPPRFADRPPVNPTSREVSGLMEREWQGTQGLAEDVKYYGQWMRDQALRRIGHLYPAVRITPDMCSERNDLRSYVGKDLPVIAWLWARTVKSPNPAFAHVDVPLMSTFMLTTKVGKETYVEPVISGDTYSFKVRMGGPNYKGSDNTGTKLSRGANFRCLISGVTIDAKYIRSQAQAGQMRARLIAVVAQGSHGRLYLSPQPGMEALAASAVPSWKPDLRVTAPCHDVDRLPMYGMPTWGDAFTPRQLSALAAFSDLVVEAATLARRDALATGLPDGVGLEAQGSGACAYAEAVSVYLAFALDKTTDYSSTICSWISGGETMRNTFGRQAIPMVWDYAEANVLSESTGSYLSSLDQVVRVIRELPTSSTGSSIQEDAKYQSTSRDKVISTDPPYYDNIGYADLSDFFYVWLRRSMKSLFPGLFATVAVPKVDELVALPHRHASKDKAEAFFLHGMTLAMHRLAEQSHPAFPVTIYYAFKQSETASDEGTASTGWEAFLEAIINAGFALTGTWPMRTELANKVSGIGRNMLASSIVLVCRRRGADSPTASRRDFLTALKAELPVALTHLQRGNIAPVDLAQAAIGPGMAVYTRYAKVLDADGKQLSVRDALAVINQMLDEALAEQEGDFDAATRWALAWFEQSGFTDGEYGVGETLSKAKNTTVAGMVEAGILASKGGKVRLLRPVEMNDRWDSGSNRDLTAWEAVHHLVGALEGGGESAAAEIVTKLAGRAEVARELAYRLYTICERKKRAPEAISYNALVQSWPEILRLSRQVHESQSTMFNEES
jgi:putative DNA methylase